MPGRISHTEISMMPNRQKWHRAILRYQSLWQGWLRNKKGRILCLDAIGLNNGL